MRVLHRNITKKRAVEKKPKIDLYLSRLSHLSQVGLLVIAVIGYFYTVVPLYQKSLLDEQIAQKELELKASKIALEENYREFRRGVVHSYIFYAGAECSGLFERPMKLLAIGEKPLNPIERYGKIFELDVNNCLVNELLKNKKLKKILRAEDFDYLLQKVKVVGVELNQQRLLSLREFNTFPERVKENPSILEPLEQDSFSFRYLQTIEPYMSPESYQRHVVEAKIERGLSRIVHDYKKLIQAKVESLSEIEWAKESPMH